MKIILVIALAISAILAMTEALVCFPCDSTPDTCLPLHKLNCKGGLVKSVCGCCATCAKVKGEKCGGPWWGMGGTCDCGLTCYKSPIGIPQKGLVTINHYGKCIPKRACGKS